MQLGMCKSEIDLFPAVSLIGQGIIDSSFLFFYLKGLLCDCDVNTCSDTCTNELTPISVVRYYKWLSKIQGYVFLSRDTYTTP
jgi:hypothetical protein